MSEKIEQKFRRRGYYQLYESLSTTYNHPLMFITITPIFNFYTKISLCGSGTVNVRPHHWT